MFYIVIIAWDLGDKELKLNGLKMTCLGLSWFPQADASYPENRPCLPDDQHSTLANISISNTGCAYQKIRLAAYLRTFCTFLVCSALTLSPIPIPSSSPYPRLQRGWRLQDQRPHWPLESKVTQAALLGQRTPAQQETTLGTRSPAPNQGRDPLLNHSLHKSEERK